MIPKRIELSGFLCYQEEQEIAFDGSALWMLSGLNGSGKSSIFDAVTYALFGSHRGGSQGAADLINKNANGFSVEFDFVLEGQPFRIRRTLKRKGASTSATQQVLELNGGEWLPVADTHRKTEFDAWVRDHIGLNYETFTSSVLLLQGRAEKLLDSTAKGRAEVLASIVDLERYQKLHEKADIRRKLLRAGAENLQNQLNAIPEVTEIEVQSAQHRIDEAEQQVRSAQETVERLQGLQLQAQQWERLEAKLAGARQRQRQAAQLMQEATAIEHDLNRLNELRDVLPHLEVIVQRRADLGRSEERTKALADVLRNLQERQANLEHALEQARSRKARIQERIAKDERQLAQVAEQLPGLSAQVERVRQLEEGREKLALLERDRAEFPPDLPSRLAEAQNKHDELTKLQQALSPLSRFAQSREQVRQARERHETATRAEAEVKARGEEIRDRLDALKPQAEEATKAVRAAEEKFACERALQRQAVESFAELDNLAGAQKCRTCGQPLTAKHLSDEKVTRRDAVAAAEERVRQASAELSAARERERGFAAQLREWEEQIQAARDEFKDKRHHAQQAQDDLARFVQECQREYTELEDQFRRRIAAAVPIDWTDTTFPTQADLDAMRRSTLGATAARRDVEHAREALMRFNNLGTRIKSAREALDDLAATISGHPAEVRREYARLDAEAKALGQQLAALRERERADQAEIDRVGEELATIREAARESAGRLETEEVTRKHCQQAIASARKSLSPVWQSEADRAALAEMNRLRGERDDLEKSGVEARADELRSARIENASIQQTLADLEREREGFPEEARRAAAEVAQELVAARSALAELNEALNAARSERDELARRDAERRRLREQLCETEREWKYFKTIAELLGRDRLQRHLVRQAERQIVDRANGVLDRLSGGTLMLRLVGNEEGGADQALELEAFNRATGASPINVAFLSGSQRFRVAVSLALGIGQFASRLHRPIESVIIDEGFGCLDKNGRQVMIQELHNLRGHLQCILLVSHQEEFADAFADGYRFELTDGATKVTRIQR